MIRIVDRSPILVFEQIRAQIEEQIVSGALLPEQRLPTVRQLAADLGIAAGTVSRAYGELEAAGLIETRGRNGTRVSANLEDRSVVLDAALDYVATVKAAGATLDQALLAVRASWQ